MLCVRTSRRYDGKKADIFSFGMLLYCILHDSSPSPEPQTLFQISYSIVQGRRPVINEKIVPIELKTLMQSCWAEDPNQRPNIAEITEQLIKLDTTNVNEAEKWEYLQFCDPDKYSRR